MTPSEFEAAVAEGYNRIPLTVETLADLDTPLSLYLKLAHEADTFLLESVQGGERFGRYSIIGLRAPRRLEVRGRSLRLTQGEVLLEQHDECDPLDFIGAYLARLRVPPRDLRLPRFYGGLVGFFGYETVRHVEPRLARGARPDPLGTPDILLLDCDEVAIVDNLKGSLTLVVWADPARPGAYVQARVRLSELLARLRAPVSAPASAPVAPAAAESAFGEAAFKQAVARAKDYILEGDIMQVVLSQRMSKPFAAPPLALYRALRTLNPSPYMFFFDFGTCHLVGASPEILVRVDDEQAPGAGRRLTLRPIAGTRRRGVTQGEDMALEQELLADQKERAEHLQLLDLGRNDVGRVATTGSVRVTESFMVERYSHVMHIVSNVEGRLQDGLDALAVLRATFPAGTVSGAPKVRAMEIIDELEPAGRGVYSGAVGYLGYHGEMDLAIAIRSALIKDQTLHVQAGAGIVADSDPQSEWQETQNKAKAVLRAAEMAEAGLDTRMD